VDSTTTKKKNGDKKWVFKRRELSCVAIVNEKNARIRGIPTISFQLKLYSQNNQKKKVHN